MKQCLITVTFKVNSLTTFSVFPPIPRFMEILQVISHMKHGNGQMLSVHNMFIRCTLYKDLTERPSCVVFSCVQVGLQFAYGCATVHVTA